MTSSFPIPAVTLKSIEHISFDLFETRMSDDVQILNLAFFAANVRA
jgi:hypothetical protein